jgi:putative ABC transport system permease protein
MTSASLGVAGVILSVDFSEGGRQQVLDQIRRMGTNVIVVSPRASRSAGGRARNGLLAATLVEPDRVAIRERVAGIDRITPLATGTFRLKAGDLSKEAAVVGCEPSFFRIRNWGTASGNLFDERDDRRASRLVLLGSNVARDLFGNEPRIGHRITIGGAPFEILGVLSERGQGLDAVNEDDQVYVPLRTAMRRLMNRDFYSGLLLEVGSWDEMTQAALETGELLHQRHRAKLVKGIDDFDVSSQRALAETRLAASTRLGFLVSWIGRSALAVSGLGLLAIGWIGVKARTMEIGTRRAVGASAKDIFLQILLEAGVISLLGCGAGLLVGWAASRLVAMSSNLPYIFDGPNAAEAFVVAASVNLLFSILPAVRASKMSPIRALRFE